MGGTFDPIHYGHLVTAEAARTEYGLDTVLFVPSGRPPHKLNAPISDAKHRYLMTVLATLTNPHFDVSRVDIDRPCNTYTVDTLVDLKSHMPDAEFWFITGADALAEIVTWKDAARLMQMCRFIGATRPGYSLDTVRPEAGEFYREYHGNFSFLEVPALAISSTDVRNRVKSGRSIRYLVPETVAYYIMKNGLYGYSTGDEVSL
jgi:nicotinate-nucleotide adenylyltransferase